MKRCTKDRSTLTSLGLVAIFCACSGCVTFQSVENKRVTNRHLIPSETYPSIGTAVDQPDSAGQQDELDQKETSCVAVDHSTLETSEKLALTVTEAIATALSNNLHLRVISNLPEQSGRQAEIERAQFDTFFNANLQYLQGVQQVASALQAVQGGQSQYGTTAVGPVPGTPNLMSIEQRYSTGTTARLSVGSNYNMISPIGQYLIYNPAFQTSTSLVIEQALFRGGSRRANLAGIHIAESSQKQSAAEFQVEVNQTLFDVQRAYWMAWLAESQVAIHKEFVEQAQAIYDLEKKKFEIGEGGVVQAAEATEHLHSFKAGLAQAQQQSKAARNHLFALIGLPPDDRRPLKMEDKPLAQQVILDLDRGLTTAVELRPEIHVRKFQIAQAQLELERRKNNELPDVRAYAGYSLTGLNNSLGGSLDKFDSGNFGTASLGFRYNYVFGQRAARAALDQAQMAFVRQMMAQKETEFLVQHQVRDAFDAVNSSWEVFRCQQERIAAAKVQAETFTQLRAAGQIDFDRLLRARQQLSNVSQQANSALIDYNLALNSWQLATGTMTTPLAPLENKTNRSNSESDSRVPAVEHLNLDKEIPPSPKPIPESLLEPRQSDGR